MKKASRNTGTLLHLPLELVGRFLDRARISHVLICAAAALLFVPAFAQTAGTGALVGTVTDPDGALVADAKVTAKNVATGEVRNVVTRANGSYSVPLLAPGTYTLELSRTGFKTAILNDIQVSVTETATVNVALQIGTQTESVTVEADAEQLQTESSAVGALVTEKTVVSLPLVTRNYTQIINLYSGVASDVNNANALGRGTVGTSDKPILVHGVNSTDNNFQMNGVEINDFQQASSADISGGIAIPNPDTIAEFKIQTGQYDAAYGRDAGANVNVVTKGGTNQYHGTAFEFFRNEAVNANDYFRNATHQPRPPQRQNQYGFTFGGPVKKDKLSFFTSYQGTRQFNGSSAGCASSVSSPALTNDRSAAALGALFAGQRGFFQTLFGGVGPAIAADGSNINPAALKLLQAKLPNGQYVIPTPQTLDSTKPFDTRGFSTFASPCTFNEWQVMANADYLHSDKSKFSWRFFHANSDQNTTLPLTTSPPGSPTLVNQDFYNLSLSHTYTFSPNLFNQASFGFHRTRDAFDPVSPFSFSSIGSTVPTIDDAHPVFYLPGMELGNIQGGQTMVQDTFVASDALAYVHGRHTIRVGGGLTRVHDGSEGFHFFGFEYFLSWADLLLGLNGPSNGTGVFSNVYLSEDLPALGDRAFRVWEGNAYFQDDLKVNSRFTLNLGVRYERKGAIADDLGRNTNIYVDQLNPNPPAGGTLQGFVVPSNYTGTLPTGVQRLGNEFGIEGDGQNAFGPRIGFAWQLPGTNRVVLRGGYGIYYSRIAGTAPSQGVVNQPFGQLRVLSGIANAAATLQNPLPAAPTLPQFTPYSPTTAFTPITVSATFRPPVAQQYSLGTQTDLGHDLLLQIGYTGTRGTKLIRERSFNAAGFASTANPIRGETTNTLANLALRTPYLGFGNEFSRVLESAGSSWYNALETSLRKRFSHGLQFLASYTFARNLTTEPDNLVSAVGVGGLNGDPNDVGHRYGPDSFTREQRFIASYVYELPQPHGLNSARRKLLGGWSVAGVTTIQSGQRLSILASNGTNYAGISSDYAQITPGCSLATSGSLESRLNKYINTACIVPTPVIGSDGVATAFGNSRPGILTGPRQSNTDLSIIKHTGIRWPNEAADVEFRTEFFNVFNHPQFANPALNSSFPGFGQITTTSVNARIVQFALKYNF